MRLKAALDLPARQFVRDRAKENREWMKVLDEFNALANGWGDERDELHAFAEIDYTGIGYNDPWEAQIAGKAALMRREVISGYARMFRLDVRDSRLFIIRR